MVHEKNRQSYLEMKGRRFIGAMTIETWGC
jgi:hypothetical protein